MSLKHGIFEAFIGGGAPKHISASEYKNIKDKIEALNEIADIERKFAIVFLNFQNIEYQNFDLGFNWMMGRFQKATEFQDLYAQFNQSITNFLSSIKMYHDQTDRNFSHIEKLSGLEQREVKRIRSSIYDGSFIYRFGENLRNFAQHNSLPVKGLSLGSRRVKTDTFSNAIEFSFDPYIEFKPIVNSKKTHASVRKEIRAMPCDYVDLKYFVREYFSQCINLHQSIQSYTKIFFDQAIKFIESERHRLIPNPKNERLVSIGLFNETLKSDPINIGSEIIENIRYLRKKNEHIRPLERFHFTSEVVKNKQKQIFYG